MENNMKTIHQDILEDIYTQATELAFKGHQVAGKGGNFYVTLEQLEAILKAFEE